jgi:hypothetical protein
MRKGQLSYKLIPGTAIPVASVAIVGLGPDYRSPTRQPGR